MLRTIVALLVVANLAFLAWSRGWLSPWLLDAPGGDADQREPARLARQVAPDSIVVVGHSEARRLAASQCMQVGPFDAAGLNAAEDALERMGIAAAGLRRVAVDDRWLLRLPEASPAQQAQLQALRDPVLGPGFVPCP